MAKREREKSKARKAARKAAPPSATLRNLRMSPFKVRRVLDVVRGRSVDDAVNMLRLIERRAAEPVLKLLQSAMANAEEKGVTDIDRLHVVRAWADGGQTLRRFRPRAHGRATKVRKRTTTITLVLDIPGREPEAPAAAPAPLTSAEPMAGKGSKGSTTSKGAAKTAAAKRKS